MGEPELAKLLKIGEQVLKTLQDALQMEESSIVCDAAIKRFEYNFEIVWKIIKQFARAEGEDCNSPKSAFKVAFKLGWLKDDKVWLNMLDDRNQTTHTYKEATAEFVYSNLSDYTLVIRELYGILRKSFFSGIYSGLCRKKI